MLPERAPSTPPTPAIIFDMLMAHQRTAALKAAIELDIFRAIGQGPGDVASIAKQCGASERGIRILCDFLTINGVITKQNGRYEHTTVSAMFLDPASPTSLASMAAFLGNDAMNQPFHQLADIVRAGRTVLPGEGSVEPDNPIWVEFAQSMAPMMAPVAPFLASLVLERYSGPMKVLDVAAGHGLFGIAFAQQNKQAEITAVDWAPVLRVALENALRVGAHKQYDILPGSAFDVDYGGPYEVALLTNFLHHFDHATCVTLLKKVHAALKPGGCAATLEFVPNEDRISPPMPAAFSLTMLASTASGDAYTFNELAAMYTEAGFSNVTSHSIPMSPETIVLGTA
jgi:hypothetical protein